MKEIKLSNSNLSALVDDKDYDLVKGFNWRLLKNKLYVVFGKRINGKYKMFYLHRYILSVSDNKVFVDHKDGNGLNCQRYNIRVSTCSQNGMNRTKQKNCKSKFKGVSFHRNKHRATIVKDKKQYHVGYFKSEENAATAYNIFAEKLHGKFANLNT